MESVDGSLKENPVCWSVATEKLLEFCSFCLKSQSELGKSLSRCAKCKFIHYCDKGCQAGDWEDHKVECKRLQKLATFPQLDWLQKKSPGYPDDGLRLIGRLHEKVRRDVDSMESNGRTWGDLVSHSQEIMETHASRIEFEEFFDLFGHYCSKGHIDKEALLEIYGKVKVNSFGIKDYKLQSVGMGLYLSLCRLDHSCDPNGRIVFHGKTAVVVPIKKPTFDSPIVLDRIRHSYIENLANLEDRRKELEKNYFFYCQCHGCMNEKRNRSMVAFACARHPDCAGQAIPTRNMDEIRCEKCGINLDDTGTPKAFEHLCKQALEKLDVPYISVEKNLELASKTAGMIEGVLHENNLDRMKVLRSAYESCVKLDKWEDAVMYGEKVLKTYRHYLSDLDPWLAGFGINLAKAHLNCKKKEEAKTLLEEFRGSLEHSFGTESTAVKELCQVLQKCD